MPIISTKSITFNEGAIKLPDYAGLDCPNCGCSNLHQTGVSNFNRYFEDSVGFRTSIKQSRKERNVEDIITVGTGEDNPSPRRNGLTIHFYCEQCPSLSSLSIWQHKGTTFIGWTRTEKSDTEDMLNKLAHPEYEDNHE